MRRLLIGLLLLGVLPPSLFSEDTPGETSLKTIRVNEVELHYLDQGKGVPVVFIHGGLEDERAWGAQVKEFSRRYRTIAYSRRYNYPNARVAARPDYSAAVDAEDLAALISALKLPPTHLIGVSYGAYTALLAALRHPALVRSLVLSEAPLLRWLPELKGGQPLFTDFMTKLWEPTSRGFRESDEAGVKAAIDGFGELGYSGTDEKMTFAALPLDVRKSILENAAEWRALTASTDALPYVPPSAVQALKAPVLLLSGERSLALHGMIDRELERLLPQRERIVLPKATHEMWNEYPEQCREAALAFLAKH